MRAKKLKIEEDLGNSAMKFLQMLEKRIEMVRSFPNMFSLLAYSFMCFTICFSWRNGKNILSFEVILGIVFFSAKRGMEEKERSVYQEKSRDFDEFI